MKTTLLLALVSIALTACGRAQLDNVKYNTTNNQLVSPTAANLRSANSLQQQGAALDAIRGNSGTVNIGGVTLTVPAATVFGAGTDRAITATPSGSNATTTWPTGVLTIPKAAHSVSSGAIALTVSTSFGAPTTEPLLLLTGTNNSFQGNLLEARFNGGQPFQLTQAGQLYVTGGLNGPGSGITNLNASNITSGTLSTARGGLGANFVFAGPTAPRTYTWPDANGTVLTTTNATALPAIFPDDTTRLATEPTAWGQLGYQQGTGKLYVGGGTGVPGLWSSSFAMDNLMVGNINFGGNGGWGTAFFYNVDGTKWVSLEAIDVTNNREVHLPDSNGTLIPAFVRDVTTVGNVGTGEDNLMAWFTTGLRADGAGYEFSAAGTCANNANAKRIKVYFGSTVVFDTGALPTSVAIEWSIQGEIVRSSSGNQKCMVRWMSNNATVATLVDYSTDAEADTGSTILKLTGTATSNDDIKQEWLKIRYVP